MDPGIAHKDLTPPRPPVQWRGLVLAVLANALLLVALAASLQWKRGPAPPADTAVMGGPGPAPQAPAQDAPAAAQEAPAAPAAAAPERPRRAHAPPARH